MRTSFLLQQKNKNGFTVIEMMVAVALFTIVMVIGVGAVLQISAVHKKTQNTRNVMDNLNFIMEDMSRNIRLGSDYHCVASVNTITDTADCALSEGRISLALEKVGGLTTSPDDQLVYRLVDTGGGNYAIAKGTTTCAANKDYCSILSPSEIHIDPLRSGFAVYNSTPGTGLQPYVIVRLEGTIVYQDIQTQFSIQTSITQRLINCDQTCTF